MYLILKIKSFPPAKLHIIEKGVLATYLYVGKITLQETLVTFPYSSPLIKLAIRPKKIPIGETQAMISNKKNVWTHFFS